MPCICEECGLMCDCEERLCGQCFLDSLDDDVEKNIYAGGRFYGESLLKGDCEASASVDGITES